MDYKDVIFHNVIDRDIHDHEVFMAFNDDDGAIAFRMWWKNEGSESFDNWFKDNKIIG